VQLRQILPLSTQAPSKTSGHYDVHSADPRMAGGRAVTSFSFPCVSVPVFSMNGGGVGFKIVRDDDIVEDGPGSIETAVCIAPGPPPPRVFRRGQVTGQANPKESIIENHGKPSLVALIYRPSLAG
jgi:hypothetical protein